MSSLKITLSTNSDKGVGKYLATDDYVMKLIKLYWLLDEQKFLKVWSHSGVQSLESGVIPESGGWRLELLRSIQITIYILATSPDNYIHMGY